MPFKMVLFWVDIRSFSEAVTCTEAPETLKFKKMFTRCPPPIDQWSYNPCKWPKINEFAWWYFTSINGVKKTPVSMAVKTMGFTRVKFHPYKPTL